MICVLENGHAFLSARPLLWEIELIQPEVELSFGLRIESDLG